MPVQRRPAVLISEHFFFSFFLTTFIISMYMYVFKLYCSALINFLYYYYYYHHHHYYYCCWRLCSESITPSLCCYLLACGPNMVASFRVFLVECYLWRSDWLKLLGWLTVWNRVHLLKAAVAWYVSMLWPRRRTIPLSHRSVNSCSCNGIDTFVAK